MQIGFTNFGTDDREVETTSAMNFFPITLNELLMTACSNAQNWCLRSGKKPGSLAMWLRVFCSLLFRSMESLEAEACNSASTPQVILLKLIIRHDCRLYYLYESRRSQQSRLFQECACLSMAKTRRCILQWLEVIHCNIRSKVSCEKKI